LIFRAPGQPSPLQFHTCHLQNTLFQIQLGSSGLERIGPLGRSDPKFLGFSLEPARAKWTVTLHGHKARGQSARARSSQMDFEASICLAQCPVRSSLHFLLFPSPTWAGNPLGESSRNGLPAHTGPFWGPIQPSLRLIRPHFYILFINFILRFHSNLSWGRGRRNPEGHTI
jgi:hypothetical protein